MELNFKKIGEGKPLLILHGLFGSLDNWMTLAKQWAETNQVWLIDQRNHGQSPHSIDFSYEHMAEDLKSFINNHQIQSPIILGHSMGGKTAMEFAVNHNDMLDKLIVIDIAPVKYQVHHYAIIEALESVNLGSLKSRKEADNVLSEKIKDFGTRQFLLKNLYWKDKEQLAWRFNLDVIKKEIIPISEWDISDLKFSGNSLFIKGGKSEYILDSYETIIANKFPNYELKIVESAGHWVHAEAPDTVFSMVSNFIKV